MPLFWRQSICKRSRCFNVAGSTYDDNRGHEGSLSISLFSTATKNLLAFIVGLHGSTDTTSRKSAFEEKMFSRKVTLPSTLIFSAKDVWTINLTDSFYLYLYLKPHEKCFFSDGGLRDRDIIFRDETDLVFCFLGCVITFSAREANSW